MESLVIFSLVLFIVSSVSILTSSNIVLATPANWSEVIRFTGTGSHSYNTTFFTCSHVEWRIRWEYVPHPVFPELTALNVFTYPQGETEIFIDWIFHIGATNTSGISYIHNRAGTFYMTISTANTQSYAIIVEQDLDSIPEFPSLIALPLFMIATLLVVIFYKRKHSM